MSNPLLDAVFAYLPSSVTRDQAISIVGSVIKGIGWALATVGLKVSPDLQSTFFGPEAIVFYSGLVMAGVPMIYDWYNHSRAGAVLAANRVPGVVKIEIAHDAEPAVKALIHDDNVPKVVSVPGPPPSLSEVKADVAAQKAAGEARP